MTDSADGPVSGSAPWRNRTALVTGGAGFIGSHLVDALIARGARVRVIDDLSSGRESNVTGDAEFMEASVLDDAAILQATSDVDVIFHLAAVAAVPRSVREPLLYSAVNARGTMNVIEAARSNDVRVLIYAGSSSAYGDQPGFPRVETMAPDIRSPYAAAKIAGEYAIQSAAAAFGVRALALRYFNIFGPRQRPDSAYAAVIPRFVDALLSGERPTIFGDGGQTRDFTHVANAVEANICAAEYAFQPDADQVGAVINVAAGEPRTVLELLTAVAGALGVEPVWNHAAVRTGEVRDSAASIARAKEVIGYEPVMSFDEGLAATVAWYREHRRP